MDGWQATEVVGASVAAKLISVNFNRTLEDFKGLRTETGEVIALSYDTSPGGATVRMWVDSEPMIVGHDVTNPLRLPQLRAGDLRHAPAPGRVRDPEQVPARRLPHATGRATQPAVPELSRRQRRPRAGRQLRRSPAAPGRRR